MEEAARLVPFPQGLPASARQVFEVLARDGPLTHRGLVHATGMPSRTIRYAVGRLKEAGVIGARCSLMDCRQCFFFVAQQCPGKDAIGRSNVVFAGIREFS